MMTPAYHMKLAVRYLRLAELAEAEAVETNGDEAVEDCHAIARSYRRLSRQEHRLANRAFAVEAGLGWCG